MNEISYQKNGRFSCFVYSLFMNMQINTNVDKLTVSQIAYDFKRIIQLDGEEFIEGEVLNNFGGNSEELDLKSTGNGRDNFICE